MKKIIIILTAIVLTNSVKAQKTDTNRYFQVSYFGQDTIGQIRYGTYFFYITNNSFPDQKQAKAIVITGYHLKFTPTDERLTVWITEFKNKKEWLKWNSK